MTYAHFHGYNTAGEWGFWLRVFGYGVSVSNSPPMFSERAKLRKTVRFFGIKFEWLTP